MSKKYKLPGGGYAGAGYFDDDIWAREKFFSDFRMWKSNNVKSKFFHRFYRKKPFYQTV